MRSQHKSLPDGDTFKVRFCVAVGEASVNCQNWKRSLKTPDCTSHDICCGRPDQNIKLIPVQAGLA